MEERTGATPVLSSIRRRWDAITELNGNRPLQSRARDVDH
jgi:hypothetical protein